MQMILVVWNNIFIHFFVNRTYYKHTSQILYIFVYYFNVALDAISYLIM